MTKKKEVSKKGPIENAAEANTPAAGPKMCKLPLENLQKVCDWLNQDSMPLPQNQVRAVLKLLFVAEVID